jgi:hypothetical protein
MAELEAAVTHFDSHLYPPYYGGNRYCPVNPRLYWSGYGYTRLWFPVCW